MKPYYYVFRVGRGNSNVKHPTLETAQKEAERLCNQHPGTTFEILKCVASVRCTQASTFWMDGEGPTGKTLYRMLNLGEIVEPGDEFDFQNTGEWRRHYFWVGKPIDRYNYPTRRPL